MDPRRGLIFAVLAALGVAGCATNPVYLTKPFVRPQLIAVLPMANSSNDLDAPVYLRQVIFNRLQVRGFNLIPLEDVDAKLKAQGFTDGGQLGATTPQKIGEWLGADGLLYSSVEEFSYMNVAFYAQRAVKVHGRLVDAATGQKLWETEREAKTRLVAIDREHAKRLFAEQLAVQAIERATHKPLRMESFNAVNALTSTLP